MAFSMLIRPTRVILRSSGVTVAKVVLDCGPKALSFQEEQRKEPSTHQHPCASVRTHEKSSTASQSCLLGLKGRNIGIL